MAVAHAWVASLRGRSATDVPFTRPLTGSRSSGAVSVGQNQGSPFRKRAQCWSAPTVQGATATPQIAKVGAL